MFFQFFDGLFFARKEQIDDFAVLQMRHFLSASLIISQTGSRSYISSEVSFEPVYLRTLRSLRVLYILTLFYLAYYV